MQLFRQLHSLPGDDGMLDKKETITAEIIPVIHKSHLKSDIS